MFSGLFSDDKSVLLLIILRPRGESMPFFAESHVSIPNKDILSWIFEHEDIKPDTQVGASIPQIETVLRREWIYD